MEANNNAPTIEQNRLTLPENARPAFETLAKRTRSVCNLDCKHCFSLSKEMLFPVSRFQTTEELLAIYIKQLLESHQTPEVTVACQGGEPTLMGLDFFKRSVAYVEKFKRPGQQVAYTIQYLAHPQQLLCQEKCGGIGRER